MNDEHVLDLLTSVAAAYGLGSSSLEQSMGTWGNHVRWRIVDSTGNRYLYWPLQSSARSSHLMWSHARDVLAAALRRRLVAFCIAEGTRRDMLGYHEGTLTDTTGDGRLPEHDHPGGVCARDRSP